MANGTLTLITERKITCYLHLLTGIKEIQHIVQLDLCPPNNFEYECWFNWTRLMIINRDQIVTLTWSSQVAWWGSFSDPIPLKGMEQYLNMLSQVYTKRLLRVHWSESCLCACSGHLVHLNVCLSVLTIFFSCIFHIEIINDIKWYYYTSIYVLWHITL